MTTVRQDPPLAAVAVSVLRGGSEAVVRVEGELDCASAPQLQAAVDGLLDQPLPPKRVVVDAERLTFADVAGLAPLVDLAERAGRAGRVELHGSSPQLARLLRLLDLTGLFATA